MKIGLLIQGPILAYGRSGRYSGTLDTATDDMFVDFNAIDTIEENIKNFGAICSNYVISTWKKEKHLLPSHFQNYNVILSEDNHLENPAQVITDSVVLQNNADRQIYSTMKGFSQLTDCTHILKIRTDQLLKSDIFGNFLHRSYDEENKIYIPCFWKNQFNLHDFYFFAKKSLLSDFFDSYSSYDNMKFYENIHADLFYKHLFKRSIIERTIPIFEFFLKSQSSLMYNHASNFLLDRFQSINKDLYISKHYRGVPYSTGALEHIDTFLFSSSEMKFRRKIIDIRRYYSSNLKFDEFQRFIDRYIGYENLYFRLDKFVYKRGLIPFL